jgi:hypothetical protein
MDLISLIVVFLFGIPVYEFFQRSMRYPEYGTLVRWFNTGWLIYALFAVVVLSAIHLLRHLKEDIAEIKRAKGSMAERSGK